MIGFKTTEDYLFDECLAFLTEHNDTDSSWKEINQRYHRLLSQIQSDDNHVFDMCNTALDYKNYLSRFKNLNGASKYQPLHKVEAEEFIRRNPIPQPTPNKRFFAPYIIDASKRNPITNLVLYLLLFASLIATIIQVPNVIWSYELFSEDGWSFIDAYGKGFIPGMLLSAVTFIGVSKIIRWRKSGLALMIISYIIILLPTACNEFEEFICFSVPSILGVIILWGILKLKKKGISTWEICKNEPRWAVYTLRLFLVILLCMILLLPPLVGLSTGFRSNIYSNGMRCLDAHLNSSPYYSYDLYQKILMGKDFLDDTLEKQNIAETWLNNARYLNNRSNGDEGHFDDEFSEPLLFLNNLIFIVKNKSNQDAIDYISSMKNKIDMSVVFLYLNGDKYVTGEYEYYKPNQEKITSLLNQVGIYNDTVDAEACEVEAEDEIAK